MLRRNPFTAAATATITSSISSSPSILVVASSLRHQTKSHFSHDGDDSSYRTVSNKDIIESKNSYAGKLMAPRTPQERSSGEVSWRTMRAQEHFFEIPVRSRQHHDWQRAREDWYKVETKLIWTAFDNPEKIPIFFRDEVIRGHRAIFEDPKWLDRALYWTKESRYWRSLGISNPFYDRDTLRVYTWDDRGQAYGQPVINTAMRDAITDLERARKRKDAGLEPNYVWDRWGPNGFIDGERSDYLPRFRHNPYVDPDGIEVADDEIAAITSHEQIRDRYGDFIWGEEIPFENCFNPFSSSTTSSSSSQNNNNLTNGFLELHDFSSDVKKFYFELNLGPAPVEGQAKISELERRAVEEARLLQTSEDIRCLIYCSTQLEELIPKYESWLENENQENNKQRNWKNFKEFLQPYRDVCDEKIEACRLLHWCSRDADQAREFFQEKCGFVDFMMTSDKILTAASLCHLKALKAIATGSVVVSSSNNNNKGEETIDVASKYLNSSSSTESSSSNQQQQWWGLPLCLALTDKEKADAIGVDAYAVWREFEDLCIDRRRRMFTQRFSGQGNEEKTLDYVLQHFAKRPERTDSDVQAMGMEFDREQEPIGRSVQRRILASDVQDRPKVQKKATGPAAARLADRKSKVANPYGSLRENQFAGLTRKFSGF